jgi:two-component system, NtrC family, response regulator HydG
MSEAKADEQLATESTRQFEDDSESGDADCVFELSVIEGHESGSRFRVGPDAPGSVLIGTSPACAVRLSGRSISRRHASLRVEGKRLHIEDLGSTNGTFVEGVAVTGADLRGGELIRLGSAVLRAELLREAPSRPLDASSFGRVVGVSSEMRRLYPLLRALSESTVPVVIEGETGTGKEALAEAIHETGPRRGGPFVIFDCTAVPPNLMEAELFGHDKGAFTGAAATRRGLIEQAHGGTLLIDEIGDLDLTLQPKLLRVIDRSELRHVGGDRTIRVDVRILAATRRNLDLEVQEGRFRDDLFHRLAIGRVELPPLRHRRGDIEVLARHFWNALGGAATPIPHAVLERWKTDPWPGNVRQIRNAVARRLALGDLALQSETASPTSPPTDFMEGVIALALPLPLARVRLLAEFERRYTEDMIRRHDGNIGAAAEASGIARRYFQILRTGARR